MRYNKPIDRLDFEPMEDKPKIRLERRKRGPAKKHIPKGELELRALTPRMRDLAEGRLKIEDLDWEELTRGQLRDVNGSFTGRKPALLPREWHDKLAAEIIKGAESQFRQNYDETMVQLMKLVKDKRTPARERLAAVIYIQERVIGRVVDKKEIKAEVNIFDDLVNNGEFLVDLGELEAE